MAKEKKKGGRGKFFVLMLLSGAVAALAGAAQFSPDSLEPLGAAKDHLIGGDNMKVRGFMFAISGLCFILFGKLTFKSKKKKK